MPTYILYDTDSGKSLYPFSLTRPVADCRLGILTIRQKWERLLKQPVYTHSEEKPASFPDDDIYWIYGGLLPDKRLLDAIGQMPQNSILTGGNQPIISRCSHSPEGSQSISLQKLPYKSDYLLIRYPWDLYQNNAEALRRDYELLDTFASLSAVGSDVCMIAPENIFIAEGATILASTLNATDGPIYIGKNATIMEGCHIRGPFSLGEGSVVKMGAKIYGATTIGPYCMVGGEIKNSIFFEYSNKAHEGYLGDSVIGAWCNWGAGTTCSNLKNTLQEIKIWIENEKKFITVGRKCGVLMGDFSRTAVQTRINSGTVIGVSSHLFGSDFPSKQVPSFSWNEQERYQIDKALRDANSWMELKGKSLSQNQIQTLKQIYQALELSKTGAGHKTIKS